MSRASDAERRRRRLIVALGALALLIVAGAVFVVLWRRSGAHQVSTEEARRRFEQSSSSTRPPNAAVLRPRRASMCIADQAPSICRSRPRARSSNSFCRRNSMSATVFLPSTTTIETQDADTVGPKVGAHRTHPVSAKVGTNVPSNWRCRPCHLDPPAVMLGADMTEEATEMTTFDDGEHKAIIVCRSRSHGNTAKIARAIASVLDAQVVDPSDIQPERVAEYDLVGFGSGIYAFSFDDELRRFVAALPNVHDKYAFVFATAGTGCILELPVRAPLAQLVDRAGYRMLGSFCCPGFDTWLPLRLIGGLNKGRPNDDDLERARTFACQVCERAATLQQRQRRDDAPQDR